MTSNAGKVEFAICEVGGDNWGEDERRITLPSKTPGLDLEPGDPLIEELVKDAHPPYVRVVKKTEAGKRSTGAGIQILADKRIKLSTRIKDVFDSPLYLVVLEFHSQGDPHFRIYDIRYYLQHRVPELLDQGRTIEPVEPIAIASAWNIIDEMDFRDKALFTSYPGQKFRFKVFNYYHDLFTEHGDSISRTVPPDLLDQVVEQGELPQCEASQLTVYWSRKRQPATFSNDFEQTLYQGENVDEVRLTLPEKGSFMIEWRNQDRKARSEGLTGLHYGAPVSEETLIGDDWYGVHHTNPEDSDEFIVYIPYFNGYES